ncbi:MAG: glycosyltransferase [Rhodobacteraceae bacterium]|nr:glycosyltransferase [Paracoccaceae bacterium]
MSLDKSCDVIDVLVTDWITLEETATGLAVTQAGVETRQPVRDYQADGAKLKVMPRLLTDTRTFDSAFAAKLADEDTRFATIAGVIQTLDTMDADGLCVDLGQIPATAEQALTPFMAELKSALDAGGLASCLIASGLDPAQRDHSYASDFDTIILKLFNEPWVGAAPAPLSENTWVVDTAKDAATAIGTERLVLAVGAFGATWETGVPLPRKRPFGEVMAEIATANASLVFNPDVSGSYAAYRGEHGQRQKTWLQDAASVFNHLSMLDQVGVHSVGLWSLGMEDPAVWPLLTRRADAADLTEPFFSDVLIDTYVEYSGTGPALSVDERAVYGQRVFDTDPATGRITNQTYQVYPKPYHMRRYGAVKPNEVVLTFDDGPHPEFTPQILDILRETETPAAFFLMGQNVMNHPDIARRVVEEGHEIGGHSFSHPRMDQITPARTHFEHNFTDRAIAGATGRATLLYREPFLRSGGPISADRIEPLTAVQARGQMVYGMDVVPKDWLGLTAQEIADYAIAKVEAGDGNVILLHDGGGEDRSASVAAVPIIISELRARGYTFVSAAAGLGTEPDVLMPTVEGVQPVFDRVSFSLASTAMQAVVAIFWIVLVIGLVRSFCILVFAAMHTRHRVPQVGPHPKLAVVIPAFNEEAAIGKCIESVMASDYPWMEIVVVDDGSSDDTLNRILEYKFEKNLRMISQPNQGKWSALNRAILSLDADVVVCIDADTQVTPDAVSKLAAHFHDARVGAVAGKIVVGNRVNLLTRMQALEYVTAQNFERRAFDRINGILVVPGAIGAWRVSALHKAGLFCQDTMTEDCDLTVSVNRAGYRVIYDEDAVAYTEAPQTLRALMGQRLRWSLGMFQSAWKHKASVLRGRAVGLVSIPDMFVFGYLFPLLAPIADLFVLLLIYTLISGSWAGDVGTSAALISPDMLWAYLALPALEFAIATFAVLSDRTAKKSLILIWPFQRIFYRPILYLTVFRALLRAMSGTLAVWGKSKRHGSDLLTSQRAT